MLDPRYRCQSEDDNEYLSVLFLRFFQRDLPESSPSNTEYGSYAYSQEYSGIVEYSPDVTISKAQADAIAQEIDSLVDTIQFDEGQKIPVKWHYMYQEELETEFYITVIPANYGEGNE